MRESEIHRHVYFRAASAKLLFVHAVLRQRRVYTCTPALEGRLIGAGVKCKSFRDCFTAPRARVILGCNKLTDHSGAGETAGKLASASANRLSLSKKVGTLLLLVCEIGCQVERVVLHSTVTNIIFYLFTYLHGYTNGGDFVKLEILLQCLEPTLCVMFNEYRQPGFAH